MTQLRAQIASRYDFSTRFLMLIKPMLFRQRMSKKHHDRGEMLESSSAIFAFGAFLEK